MGRRGRGHWKSGWRMRRENKISLRGIKKGSGWRRGRGGRRIGDIER